MIISRIKFYADIPDGKKNKLFCYSCDELHFQEFFSRMFSKGFYIRAAWFEKIEDSHKTVLINNRFMQFQLQDYFDYWCASKKEKEKINLRNEKESKHKLIKEFIEESKKLTSEIESKLQKKL